MKILFYGETPINETGAARVNRHLLDAIVESGIEIEVLGSSHFFEDAYDHARYPYPIQSISRETEMDTHQVAGEEIDRRAGSFDWLFISGDMHVPQILKERVHRHKSIVLGAIDGQVRLPELVDSFLEADIPAVYSRYAHQQVLLHHPDLAGKLRCIPLGCEPEVFYPLDPSERRAYRRQAFGIDDDTFLVMWANRNQSRKDPARALWAFHLFHERIPNSKLYMHTRREDVGGNLVAQAKLLGLSREEVFWTPDDYNEIYGFSREKQNRLYNAADVGISTSQGEGWGLTTTEFMAAGVPFIGPANTTFFELMDAGMHQGAWYPGARGYLVKSGGDDLWNVFYGRDDSPRPITSASALAAALYCVWSHRAEAQEKAERAWAWAQEHTWQHFKEQWKEVLAACLSAHLSPVSPGKMAAI